MPRKKINNEAPSNIPTPKLKIKLNVGKSVDNGEQTSTKSAPISLTDSEDSDDQQPPPSPPKKQSRKPLTPPPPPPTPPDITYFVVAKYMMDEQCIHRVTEQTKIDLFSVKMFYDEGTRRAQRWQQQPENDCQMDIESSIAKVSFKGAKQNEIEQIKIFVNSDWIHHVDPLVLFLHESGKKQLRVDWVVQYRRTDKTSIKPATGARHVSNDDSDDSEDITPSKRGKKKRKVH
jgi:hypothetical protein